MDINEFVRKYSLGAEITDSPFNSKALRGKILSRDMILEVPVQTSPVPASIISAANKNKITIRDNKGKEYK